jgi:hypothetical protein
LSDRSTRLRDASEGSSDAASDEVADAEGDNYGQCSEGQLTQSRAEQWPTGEPTNHHASGEQRHSCYRQRDNQGAEAKRHCCIKSKGVLTVSQSGKQDPSGTFETVTNQASKSLPPGLYPSRWTSSGKPIA